jgi:RCC1 and BTB domain-containing protein
MCKDMIDISCGSSHSLAIDKAGKIYSWGNGQGGRLGHNKEVGENAPR